jgi:DNA-binding transcriptional MerR regulator/methylmalonyl-CoA mutase cobalamin-binding subunit
MNMKAVVRETGLKADTIRAWERRYGLPQPTRTPGGHRLYSQRDVEAIKWLVAKREQGMRINRAVELWRNLEAEGKDPLVEEPYDLSPPLVTGSELVMLREQWLKACMVYDEREAEQVMTRALGLFPPEAICLDLILVGLVEIGEAWYKGELTVQQEHFASELAVRRLETLIASEASPSIPGRILVICPPDEEHTISALAITFLLRRRGRDVLFLGANVPLDRLQEAIVTTKPRLVIVTVQRLETAASLKEMTHLLTEYQVPIAYGGRIFNEIPLIRETIPAFFLGESLDQVHTSIDSLLTSSPLNPEVKAPDVQYSRALQHFIQRQAQVEASLREDPTLNAIAHDQLGLANLNLAGGIRAALTLGNMDYMDYDLEWTKGILVHQGIPTESLDSYLQAYHRSLTVQLDERGQPIIDYFAELIEGDE